MDLFPPFRKYSFVRIVQVAAANSALPSTPEVTDSPGASVTRATTKYEPPFHFLDLPKDIRLMIYEFLPIKTTHHKMLETEFKPYSSGCTSYLTLVVRSLDGVAILRTCRLINSEATAILQPALKSIREDPMRIIADELSISSRSLYDIFKLLMTNRCHKPGKFWDSPTFKNSAIQSFLRLTSAKGGLPQIHVALDFEGEIRESSRVLDHIYHLASLLDGRINNPILCIVHQRWKRFTPNGHSEARGLGDVAQGVPDSSIPECKWIVRHKPDIDFDEWDRVWAEGVEFVHL